jgi:hypothetical protein
MDGSDYNMRLSYFPSNMRGSGSGESSSVDGPNRIKVTATYGNLAY